MVGALRLGSRHIANGVFWRRGIPTISLPCGRGCAVAVGVWAN